MAKAKTTGVRIDGRIVPGKVLRGFVARDPELVKSVYHPAGRNTDVVITLGLGGRPILVPMLLYDASWERYADVADFLRELEKRKAEGGERIVTIPNIDGDQKFTACLFEGFDISPNGILFDHAGTLAGGWFCEGLLKFYQVKAV